MKPKPARPLLLLLLAAGISASALAQSPPAGEPPKHGCGKPENFPGHLASDQRMRSWQRNYLAYTECLKNFISEQQALAEPHIKAGNAAIAEYNAAVKEFNAAVEATKENANQDTKPPQ